MNGTMADRHGTIHITAIGGECTLPLKDKLYLSKGNTKAEVLTCQSNILLVSNHKRIKLWQKLFAGDPGRGALPRCSRP